MKLNKVPQVFFAIVLALSQVFAIVPKVNAQEEGTDPWANVFDENGNLLPSVVDMGEIVSNPPPDWWPSNAVTDALGFYPTYHQYVTANGDVVIVPSASTLFLMTLNPESGIGNADGAVGIGTGTLIMASGLLVRILEGTASGQGLLSHIAEMGYTDPSQFADALISGEENIWSLAFIEDAFNILSELMNGSVDDRMFATTFLLYMQGNCANSPTGCPADLCLIAPVVCTPDPEDPNDPGTPVNPPSCPAASVHIGNPTIKVYSVAPASPLVVGQDPEKRGADVQLEVVIPPTIHEYYIPIPIWEDREECNLAGTEYTGVLDCKTDNILPANNGYITEETYLVRFDCEQHIDVYAEQIVSVQSNALLTEASKDWIVHDLGAYYYGARVYESSYNLVPGMRPAAIGCDGSKTCFASTLVEKIQFRDPGYYSLNVRVQTAGTPVTSPRLLTGGGQMSVSMISARLIEAGN